MIVDQHIYRKAFQEYLRKGTPIAWSIKQERPTTHYIWRTRRDNKVRPAHADREGQIFSWDEPPTGGHPGEDHNCRCTAEPYFPEISEYMNLTIDGLGTKSGWSDNDFVEHYFSGHGRGVTLTEIGHLRKIVREYIVLLDGRLEKQIADAARRVGTGSVFYDFQNTYQMESTVFSIGDTTIGGIFSGQSKKQNGILYIEGSLSFYLRDVFADPIDLGIEVDDYRPGSIVHDIGHGLSDVAEAIGSVGETLYDNVHKPLDDYLRGRAGLKNASYRLARKHGLTGRDGIPYPITGAWSGRLDGQVYADATRSMFRE